MAWIRSRNKQNVHRSFSHPAPESREHLWGCSWAVDLYPKKKKPAQGDSYVGNRIFTMVSKMNNWGCVSVCRTQRAGRWNCGKVWLPDYLKYIAAWFLWSWGKRALSRHEAAVGLNYIKAFKSLVSGHWTEGERGGRMGHRLVHKTMMHPIQPTAAVCASYSRESFHTCEETLAIVSFLFIIVCVIQEASLNDYRLKKICCLCIYDVSYPIYDSSD